MTQRHLWTPPTQWHQTMSSLAVALGVALSGDPVAKVTYGDTLYGWGTAELTETRKVGQGIAESDIYSLGVGARKSIGDFWVFGEFGYSYLDHTVKPSVQEEVVYTELVQAHNVYNRPVPVDQSNFDTRWEADDGLVGVIGVGYRVTPSLSLELSYRDLTVKEYQKLYTEGRDTWWQETNYISRSTTQFMVSWTF